MPRILVVESNPKVVSDRLETLSGQALGQLYAATLEGLRDDVETVVISPYDGDETPEMSGFDGIAFTGSSVEWNTDDERAAPAGGCDARRIRRRAFDHRILQRHAARRLCPWRVFFGFAERARGWPCR